MVLRGRRDTLEGMDTPAAPDSPDRPDEKKKRVWPFLFAPKWVSWAYTFEWPLFAVFAVVFWAKTIRDEFRILRGEIPRVQNRLAAEPDLPLTVAAVQSYTSASTELEVYDPELAAYNAYLSRLNSEVKDHGKWHGLR
jgi:hypothetical protein